MAAPSLNVSSSINYTNNAPPTAIAPSLSIGNADSSATLTGAKVQIASRLSSNEDRLGILGQSGISGTKITWSYNTNTGELTLSGNDSVDNYQSVLRQVAYSDLSNTPNTAQRTIGYSVQFGSSAQQINGSSNPTIVVGAPTRTTTVNNGGFDFESELQFLLDERQNSKYNDHPQDESVNLVSLLFNEKYYLAQNPDVAAASAVKLGEFESGFEHFITFGRAEGRFGIG